MAKITIHDIKPTVRQIRKGLRRVGLQYRRLYSWHIIAKWPRYKDPKSPAQLECRAKFKRAQELMMEDFKQPKQAEWWELVKVKKGYKTAKGCARGYYYALLCQLELSQTDPTKKRLKLYKRPKTWTNCPLYHLDFEGDNLTERTYLYADGKITFRELWEWHVEDQKKRVIKPRDDDDDDDDEMYDEDGKRIRWVFNHFR